MNRHVSVSLFKTIVFPDIMKIVAANHNGPLHFHLDDNTTKNSPSNGNVASERTFLIDVCSFNCLKHNQINKIQIINIFNTYFSWCFKT